MQRCDVGVGDPMSPSHLFARPLIWLVRLYQLLISPLLPPSCRFTPCCSAYAITALTRFGVFRGGWLTVRRLARCHPWNPGGVDHVPPLDTADRSGTPTPAPLN